MQLNDCFLAAISQRDLELKVRNTIQFSGRRQAKLSKRTDYILSLTDIIVITDISSQNAASSSILRKKPTPCELLKLLTSSKSHYHIRLIIAHFK